jgi:transcriptional antiterminator RfaH
MSAREPQPVPQGLVEGLILATSPEGNVHFDFHLKQGQTIRITAGPFANMVGELEKLDDTGRVRVLLEIMGSNVRVALPQMLVAPH